MSILNYDSMRQPISASEIAQYREKSSLRLIAIILLVVPTVILTLAMFIGFLSEYVSGRWSTVQFFTVAPLVAILGLGLVFVFLAPFVLKRHDETERLKRNMRLFRLAEGNQGAKAIWYQQDLSGYSGLLFGEVTIPPYIASSLTLPMLGDTEIGNLETAEKPSIFNHFANIQSRGYVKIPLTRHVPHIILDGHLTSQQMSPLYGLYHEHVLELEGDFNKYFTVYTPDGYEKDALLILTPDVMASLLGLSGYCDIELVDNQLYLYPRGPLDPAQSQALEYLMGASLEIASQIGHQTKRYSDERTGDRVADIVAQPGKRMSQDRGSYFVGGFAFMLLGLIPLLKSGANAGELALGIVLEIAGFVLLLVGIVVVFHKKHAKRSTYL